MIDSLFILGEDKQIVIEKHWKGIINRSVLDPFYSSLNEFIDSYVWVPVVGRNTCRISHLYSKVTMPS